MENCKTTIVLVEDDAGIRDSVKLILENDYCDVITLSTGNPILKGVFTVPDLFILDKQLSGVSGLDVCRFLKQTKATSFVPIIMISASPQAAQPAIEAGADAFIEKPFNATSLRQLVYSLI